MFKDIVKSMFKKEEQYNETELEYMNEVDAALHRRGHPLAFTLSLAVVAFFFVFSIWACFAEIDEVTRGQGQVVPSQRIQEIQNLEGGILQEMNVREGDKVVAGQTLGLVQNDKASSAVVEYEIREKDQEANLMRLRAELNKEIPAFPEDMLKNYPQLITNQQAIYQRRQQQFESEKTTLRSEITQRNQEVDEALARKQASENQLVHEIKYRDTIKPLVAKGIEPAVNLLQVEQRISNLQGEANTLTQSIAKARSAVQGAESRFKNRDAEVQSAIQEEINKRDAELSSIRAAKVAIIGTQGRTMLISPVNGIVQRIHLNTIGGSVKGGETIMEILPIDNTLVIEARIKPSDRAFVFPNQRAIIKISAYDFSVYGGLEGHVEQISASTIEDKRGETYYEVRLRTQTNYIQHRGKNHDIIPGMTATVDIVTGKKTVMAFLLKPIIKAQQEALQER